MLHVLNFFYKYFSQIPGCAKTFTIKTDTIIRSKVPNYLYIKTRRTSSIKAKHIKIDRKTVKKQTVI